MISVVLFHCAYKYSVFLMFQQFVYGNRTTIPHPIVLSGKGVCYLISEVHTPFLLGRLVNTQRSRDAPILTKRKIY